MLKHQWLYLNTLETIRTAEELVAFYVQEHNTRLPHSAFRGQTPNEMCFGTGVGVPQELETSRIEARQARLMANRAQTCRTCEKSTAIDS